MKSRWKKSTTIALVLLILVSSVPSYGAAGRFKDVDSSHWAFKSIEDMAKLGFLNGYTDGTFRPDVKLKFIETMSALLKFLNPTKGEIVGLTEDYASLFYDLKIEDPWKKEALAVALNYDVITENRLKMIASSGNLDKMISRADFSEYLVKAMGLEEEANNQKVFSLPYNDAFDIPANQHKYVNILLKAKVLNPDGKGGGMFKPKDSLTRAEMARMLSVGYEFLEANPGIVEPKPEETEIIKGKISKIIGSSPKDILYLYDELGIETAYYLDKNTRITIDGKIGSNLDLAPNQNVELKVKRNSIDILEIDARSIEEVVEGKIKSIKTNTSTIVIEYVVNKNTFSKEYTVDKNAKIYLDGAVAKLTEIKEGSFGRFEVKNNVIYDLDVLSKTKKVEGIVKELALIKDNKDSKDKEYYILVEDKKENTHEYIISPKTVIYRNDRKVNDVEEIKLKDEIYIDGDYDFDRQKYIAYDIDAYVVVRKIKGVIVAINSRLHQKTELTIFNQETKKEEEYILGKDVYIRIDGRVTNSYDLKTGYYLDIKTEGDEIVEIDADTRGVEKSVLGKIIDINYSTYTLTIEVQDFSFENESYGEIVYVYTRTGKTDKTNIVNKYFKEIGFHNLSKNDIINIVGSYDGSSFVADTIQVR